MSSLLLGKSGNRDEVSGKDEKDIKKDINNSSKESADEPMDVDDVKSEDKKPDSAAAVSASS